MPETGALINVELEGTGSKCLHFSQICMESAALHLPELLIFAYEGVPQHLSYPLLEYFLSSGKIRQHCRACCRNVAAMLPRLATMSADKSMKKFVAQRFEHVQTFPGNVCCSTACCQFGHLVGK